MSSRRHYTALAVAGALVVAAVLMVGCNLPPAPTESSPTGPPPQPPVVSTLLDPSPQVQPGGLLPLGDIVGGA